MTYPPNENTDKFQGGLINSYLKVTNNVDPSTHPRKENTDI